MNNKSEILNRLFAEMPPLSHVPPDGSVPLEDSEVFQWISRNNELLYYLFERARATNSIRFDYARRKWCGRLTPVPVLEREDRGRVEKSLMPSRGPGRPLKARVRDAVKTLPGHPVSVSTWATICIQKFGICRRTFARLKSDAISMGLVTVAISGRHILCQRNAAAIAAQNSSGDSPVVEPNSGSVATPEKFQN